MMSYSPKRSLSIKRDFSLTGLLFLSLLFISIPSLASQNELSGVKSEISRQKNSLSSKQNELNKLQKSLKQHELSISSLTQEIKKTQSKLTKANSNLKQFNQQKAKLEKQKETQTETLKQLITAYYATKKDNEAKALLNSANSEEEARISYYFQHLAERRAKAIEELNQTSNQLTEKNKQLLNEKKQIANLLAQQKKKKEQLTKSQGKRKSTIKKIRGNISSDKSYLAELQRNETRLTSEIAKAAKRNAVPMDGLAKQKGKLPWPLKGKILHNYGTRQSGQVNWKGMVIDAYYDQPVKAVYSGTVVFAEYLRGYGLVVLLDHGKGDMTLYGFNQALLKVEGDKVKAGETIALAGNTGGQPQASLYFEIRRNSKTQNPKRWLK